MKWLDIKWLAIDGMSHIYVRLFHELMSGCSSMTTSRTHSVVSISRTQGVIQLCVTNSGRVAHQWQRHKLKESSQYHELNESSNSVSQTHVALLTNNQVTNSLSRLNIANSRSHPTLRHELMSNCSPMTMSQTQWVIKISRTQWLIQLCVTNSTELFR